MLKHTGQCLLLLSALFFMFGLALSPAPASAATVPSCSNKTNAEYSAYPVALDRIDHIVPLGNLNPTSGHVFPTHHLYVGLNEGSNGTQARLNAPGDIIITSLASSENLTAGTADYSISFQACEDLYGYFYHVNSITSALRRKFNKSDQNCSQYVAGDSEYRLCWANVSIAVSAGDKIGTVGAENGVFDFGGYDMRKPRHQFVKPKRWNEYTKHIVCSLNYFDSEKKTELKNLLSSSNGEVRGGRYPCGRVEQDKPDTAQGAWFKRRVKGSDWNEDYQLALVHGNIFRLQGFFSVGKNVANIPVGKYQFTPTHAGRVNRDFDELKVYKTYCYEVAGEEAFTILLKRNKTNKIRIQKKVAQTCSENNRRFNKRAQVLKR